VVDLVTSCRLPSSRSSRRTPVPQGNPNNDARPLPVATARAVRFLLHPSSTETDSGPGSDSVAWASSAPFRMRFSNATAVHVGRRASSSLQDGRGNGQAGRVAGQLGGEREPGRAGLGVDGGLLPHRARGLVTVPSFPRPPPGGMICASAGSGPVSPRTARRHHAGNTVDQSLAIEITVHPRRGATLVIGSCSFRVPDTLS
jgi:hypothetical protein